MHRNVFTYIREHIQTGYRCHYVPLINASVANPAQSSSVLRRQQLVTQFLPYCWAHSYYWCRVFTCLRLYRTNNK